MFHVKQGLNGLLGVSRETFALCSGLFDPLRAVRYKPQLWILCKPDSTSL
jgi:hypothetical protein